LPQLIGNVVKERLEGTMDAHVAGQVVVHIFIGLGSLMQGCAPEVHIIAIVHDLVQKARQSGWSLW